MRLYLLFSYISKIIRENSFPDPFEIYEEQLLIEMLGLKAIPAAVAFLTVGLVYESGSAPLIGVILFFITNLLYVHIIGALASFGLPFWVVSLSPCVIFFLLLWIKQSLLEI